MENKKTVLGVNKKLVTAFHKLMLITILHSSFIAPSQHLLIDYFNAPTPTKYIGTASIYENPINEIDGLDNNTIENKKAIDKIDLIETIKNESNADFYIASDIKEGVIGVSNTNPLDDATDNLFKFTIANLPQNTAKVFLKYDLYGVQDCNAVSRSINERPATGGYLVKIQNTWTPQKEELNINWLQQGENKVVFSIPKNANFQYQVKNVRLEFDLETNFNSSLVLQTTALNYTKDNKLYVKGFVRNPTSTTKVLVEQTALNLLNGEFEGFITLTKEIKERKFVFINAYDDKGVVGQQIIHLDTILEADKIFEIEKSYTTVTSNFRAKMAGTLATDGAKLILNDSALVADKEISITKLRSVDIAPMGSGMVNVTKGGSAYRFLPDGTTFEKPVQIALEYDENLLPKGHSANEIKTFYFNTNSKKWIAIERDTIDKQNKSILSLTTHFTDYVNGIIQTPESPETAGFTPTMMSEIKAVDPSSEMTLISPPEVSQKGDANVSYPIKIPAGRNGLQPQLAIQYSSDGGNSWLGEGWGLSVPAISIDTKWGTPTFNPTKESEIYSMNGEQLMYPKQNGKDWMPNRHYDVAGAAPGTFSTAEIDRTANLVFTPRKQGSFAKIERVGSATTDYTWKVTNTDGTIFWYGGKDSVVLNTVIKNANGNMVYWGLYMIEDIHGNTIKYEYDNFVLSGIAIPNDNLNNGRIFRLKKIKYNGYNDADYKYEVVLVFNSTTNIRQDASINARLGVKQVEAHFLKEIVVKKVGTTEFIRKYVPVIGYGKFNKGQLQSISELDKNENLFYEHKFDYYDDISVDGADVYFSDGVEEVICDQPCQDSDGDTVCDDEDPCPNEPGPVSNNGCPECSNCYQILFPNPLPAFSQGTHVYLNGSAFYQCNSTNTFNEFFSCMQQYYPIATLTNNSLGTLLTISNTCDVFTNLTIISSNGVWEGNFNKINCNSSGESVNFKNYFSNLLESNSFSLSDGISLDTPCPDYLTNDDFLISGYIPSFDSSAGLLGSSKSEAISGGFYIGIGIGGNRFTKMTTFGVQWNWGNDKSFGLTSLIDINGDGLDDIVSKQGGNVYYKKHIITRTYNANGEPVVTHSFGMKQPVIGINNFYRAFGRSSSRNFQITFGLKRVGGFVGHDRSKNNSETDVFFTDGNGDGLMDIVRDGVVYFNRLDANGNPSFIPDSQGTENLIITAAPVTIEVPDEYTEDEITLPAFDVVKVWEAPADGNIKIENNISLLDTSKETIVSVEMKKVPQNQCFNVNFVAPFVNMPLFKYQLAGGFTGGNNLPNPFSSEVNGACSQTSWRIKQVIFNGVPYNSNANPNLLFYINGNSIVGRLNQCPSTLPPIYIFNLANHYNDAYFDISVRSFNSVPLISNWYSNILNSAGISFSNLVYNNWASNYIEPTTSHLGFNYQYWNRTEQILRFNSFENITGSIIEEYSDGNNIWNNVIYPFENGINRLFKISQENINIGVNTQVYINGSLLGTFNLYNNFDAFQTAFQIQYGTAYNIIPPTASNNYIVSITMNGSTAFNTISLVPVSNPSQSYNYNFTQINCNSLPIVNPAPIANNTFENSNIKPTKEESEYAINKWVAEGNEINLPYQDVKQNFAIDFTNNVIDNKISGNYSLVIDGKSYTWFDEQNNIIKDESLEDKLFELSGFKINNLLDELQQANIERIKAERLESQQKAIAWIRDKELENSNIISAEALDSSASRTINPTNCNETPDELCLLYGTQLNASNVTVTNTLTTNCSGQTLSVKKGDRIYFRVHSVENGNPPINWNPKVEYTNAGFAVITDANGHKPFSSSYSDGFVLSNKLPTSFPGNSGTAKISWSPFTVNPTDTVTYQIIKQTVAANVSNSDLPPTVISTHTIFTQDYNPNVSTTVSPPINLNNIVISPVAGYEANLQQTHFYFKVISTSNIDWKNSVWKPELECTTVTPINPGDGAPTEGNVTSVNTLYPVPDYDLYRYFPCGVPFKKKTINTINNGLNLSILPNLTGVFSSGDNGKVNFVVKRGTTFIGKRLFTITNGNVTVNNSTPIPLGNTGANDIEIMFTVDDSESDGSSESLLKKIALTSNVLARISYGTTTVNVPKTEIILYQKTDPRFGNFYRNWGQFMYNPANVTGALPSGIAGTNLIKEEALVTTSLSQTEANQLNTDLDAINDNMSAADLAAFEASHMNYINNIAFLSANPLRENIDGVITDRWTGFHKENYTSEFAYRAASLSQSMTDLEEGYENIEQGVLQTGAFAISKYAKGKSDNNFSAGVSFYGVGVNASVSNNGFSNALTDYVDYNGDRYPDIVSTDKIQFTNKTGGLFTPTNKINEPVSVSSSDSIGFGATGSFGKNSDDSSDKAGGKSGFVRYEGFKGNAGAGISGNFTNGNSITSRFWTDINGDGLSDLVVEDSGTTNVILNFGPTTPNTASNNWGNLPIFKSKSNAISGGLGVNKWNGSLEAGLSLSTSWNKSTNTLIDINGDGLLDMIYADDNLSVKLNIGNKFVDKGVWTSSYNLKNESASVSAGVNVGFTFALVWRFWAITFKIPALNFQASPISTTTNKTTKSITDYDGDGFADLVEQINPTKIKIYHSRIRRTDKLKSVTNPLGGKFTIDYKVQPVDYDNPNAKWAMSQVVIEDGYDKVNDGADVYKKNFVYEKGRYDRREREFYGYKTVKVEDYLADTAGNDVIYRTSVTNYHNQSYFLNGLVDNSYVIKGNDATKKYSKTINHYEVYGLNDENDEIILSTVLPATYDVGGSEGRRSAAVLLKKSISELYELETSPQLITEVNMNYDAKGRIIEYINHGNVSDASDDYTSVIEYHDTMSALNIINVPKSIKVSTPSLGLVRERTTDVDTSNGTITKVSANNNDTWAETNMEYDQYGNLIYIEYPENTAGESMFYNYTYDTVYNKYVTKIEDAFGYSSTSTYDSNFDKPLEIIDLTGNKMIYSYDDFGRNTYIIAPKEIAAGIKYTIKFDYFPYFSLLPSGSGVTFDPADPSNSTFVPVAVTSHYDQQHPTNDIQTFTFVDGMARPIQVKKDIYYNSGTAASPNFVEALTISGKTKFDALGRTIEQFHPYWEPLANNTKFLLNEFDSPYKSTVIYDELDRPIKNIDPEGNESIMEYSIDTDVDGILAIKTKADVDQNGSQHIISETFKDVNGRVISTNNVGGSLGNIWTKFKYNEIGELLEYVDNEGITTKYEYDMFGRKILVNHPDNGKTTYTYDNVNLVKLQTANLEGQGSFINYEYEINRLIKIKFPDLPSGASNFANVTYKYGDTGNQTGRLVYQEDATGIQEMIYGNMGELVTNYRKVVGPNIPTRTFTTNFQYDSWNRLQTMQYPDGEKIRYKYDLGGSLTTMTGELNGDAYEYIKRIDYDYFEQRTYLLYGNHTETFYNYTPALRRLNNLNVKTSDGLDLFDNQYDYDKVGNVTSLLNSAGITANDMAGKYGHKFEYDAFNRLAYAEGNFEGSTNQIETGNDANSKYTLKMGYNSTHGIVSKDQIHEKNGTSFMPNTYDNAYQYITDTHKVERITNNTTGETEGFKYDANGNITDRYDNNTHRLLLWDESNRLRVVTDNQSMQHYIYDGSGERVLKANSDMEAVYENGELVNAPGTVSINGYTSYPSAFIVITADGVYSKHYYAGAQRIVSRLGDNDASIFENGCINCKQEATENSFDDQKLKLAQIDDLNYYAEKAQKGKVTLKEYKPISVEEQEKAMAAEGGKEIERAPSVPPIYYYHPDHLGTSTALTDFNGNAYQFFLNLPFGETMAQQLGSNYYNSPYKFNGKELDEETGFYYYGARYYDPKISIWLSVDPLAEKFPNFNPYNYVMQNPLNLIDPTGMSPEEGGNDPKTNVIVFIYGPTELEQRKSDYKGKDGWNAIFATSIDQAFEEVNRNYNDGTIDNLVISSHANNSEISIGKYVVNNNIETRAEMTNETISAYNKLTKDEFLDYGYSETSFDSIDALSKISNKVKENGNIAFSGCLIATGELFPSHIANTVGKDKFNIFFNVGLGGISGENKNDSIRHNSNNNEKILMFTKGVKSYISDFFINNNNNSPITIIK